MSRPWQMWDPPVDTVGDGTEFAGFVTVNDAFGRADYYIQTGFSSMAAARAWAKQKAAGLDMAEMQTGAYRVLREEHR